MFSKSHSDNIMKQVSAYPQADTSTWEKEIDQLVYQLYGLTQEEIAIVEGVQRRGIS